jgi:hypothetical protein
MVLAAVSAAFLTTAVISASLAGHIYQSRCGSGRLATSGGGDVQAQRCLRPTGRLGCGPARPAHPLGRRVKMVAELLCRLADTAADAYRCTVRLMALATVSAVGASSEPGDVRFLRGALVRHIDGALARSPAGRQQLTVSMLGEPSGPITVSISCAGRSCSRASTRWFRPSPPRPNASIQAGKSPDARTYFAEIISVAVLITLLENAEVEQVSTARTSVVTDIETAVQAFREFLSSFIAASGLTELT